MDRIRILGGKPLAGAIPIGGAKNAALPIMAAGLLTGETLTLTNLPRLVDISTMAHLLGELGVDVGMEEGNRCTLSAADVRDTAPYNLVRKMRASVLVLGPLLARLGHARVSLPGGCAIGTRPVDLHLKALAQLGADIRLEKGYVEARAPGGLKGAHVVFPMVTVGGTENALMAAVLADGETVLSNAAREPEVADLARCLIAMGARIEGVGGDSLRITGVRQLCGAKHAVLPDRIETGTYAMAAAITGGEVILEGACLDLIGAAADALREARVEIAETPTGVRAGRASGSLEGVDITTEPYPGFPTDLQAQLMALMSVAGRRLHDHRDHFREPLHARARTLPHGGQHRRPRSHGHGQGCGRPVGGLDHGHGYPGLGVTGSGGPGRRGRNHRQPGLSPRPRLRAVGGEARRLRRRHRKDRRLGGC